MNYEKYKKLYYSEAYFTLVSSSEVSPDQIRSVLPFGIRDNSPSNYLLVFDPDHRDYGIDNLRLQKQYHLKNPALFADSWKIPKMELWNATQEYRKINRPNTFIHYGSTAVFFSPEHFGTVCFFIRVHVRSMSIEYTNMMLKILQNKLGFYLVSEEETPYLRKIPNFVHFVNGEEEWDSDLFLEMLDEYMGDVKGWNTLD